MLHILFINVNGKETAKLEVELDSCDDIDIYTVDTVHYTMTTGIVFVHVYHHTEVSVDIKKSKYAHCDDIYTQVTIRGGNNNE